MITDLLLWQSHSYVDRLYDIRPQVDPANVKRAIDFIEAHLREPITLGDITRAAGVPGRTLLQNFRDHRGTSPMRYLRDARFVRVREDLSRAPERSITRVAMLWGFYHLGRFAVEYRKRFGETPSQTRAKGRRAAGADRAGEALPQCQIVPGAAIGHDRRPTKLHECIR